MFERMTIFSMDYPKTVIGLLTLLTLLFALQFPNIAIDADPENMLETLRGAQHRRRHPGRREDQP